MHPLSISPNFMLVYIRSGAFQEYGRHCNGSGPPEVEERARGSQRERERDGSGEKSTKE